MRRLLMAGVVAFAVALAFVSGPTGEVGAQIGYQIKAATVTVTSQLLLPSGGTANDPTVLWADDDDGTGTGMYRPAADQTAFSVAGVQRLIIRNTGIGTSAGSAANPSFNFGASGDLTMGMWRIAAGNLGFGAVGALVLDIEDTNAAGAGADLVTISSITGIMNSSGDIVNALSLNITSADHTNGVLNALKVGTITGDTHSTESLFFLGDGYDYFINDVTDAALGTTTWTTNADKDAETAAGTLKVWLNGTLYHIQLYADS